jgi:hypothetical protein
MRHVGEQQRHTEVLGKCGFEGHLSFSIIGLFWAPPAAVI